LQAWEIFEAMHLDTDLVTLSGCDTGSGRVLAGEGIIGLTRAFRYAGARSLLASLWKVPDESTARLMVDFYRHLERGAAKDEALRRAQLVLLRDPDQPAWHQPYFWAAFQLSGDPRPLVAAPLLPKPSARATPTVDRSR
jgi:CHAT domain-containing protein